MKTLMPTILAVALLAAGVTGAQTTPGRDYRGEVWTWDAQRGTVTLLQGSQAVRVRVTPDQLKGLRMHETTTVHGVADGPAPLEQVMTPGPSAFVGRGPAQEVAVTGTVAAVDARGVITIDAGNRRVQVWTAQPGGSQFKVGDSVDARIRVQPGTVAPASGAAPSGTTAPTSVRTQPGDYAVFVGSVTAEDAAGGITIDTPRGPITFPMPQGTRPPAGEIVEVSTEVRPAR